MDIKISAMPNPQNYKNPLVIYTAQDAKDIVGINNVFLDSIITILYNVYRNNKKG